MTEEKWIESVMTSRSSVREVHVNPAVTENIMKQIAIPAMLRKINWRWVPAVAAALLLLTWLNVTALHKTRHSFDKNNEVRQLLNEYGWQTADPYSPSFSNPGHE